MKLELQVQHINLHVEHAAKYHKRSRQIVEMVVLIFFPKANCFKVKCEFAFHQSTVFDIVEYSPLWNAGMKNSEKKYTNKSRGCNNKCT